MCPKHSGMVQYGRRRSIEEELKEWLLNNKKNQLLHLGSAKKSYQALGNYLLFVKIGDLGVKVCLEARMKMSPVL